MKKYRPIPPIVSFRVFPEKRWLYFTVQLYQNLKDMREAYSHHRQLNQGEYSKINSAAASCSTVKIQVMTKRQQWRTRPYMGKIFFAFPRNGSAVVAHEVSHAALAYFERMGLVHNDETDERYAMVVTNMMQAIIKRIW